MMISIALEEICSHGEDRVTLPTLFSILTSPHSSASSDLINIKQALCTTLLTIPTLQFHAAHHIQSVFTSSDPSIQSFEAAEAMNLKIVAKQHLRDNFLGLYNVQSFNASISHHQRRTLHLLALTSGELSDAKYTEEEIDEVKEHWASEMLSGK
ncbi:hypothetical protein F8388_012215 [Cannabis sativa]|uniref:General transcription factor 3C polypeptide 1 winged-helix domain-containing protein n=1 Tax=Cannabis sativa TaxID=3483 RepID=A0A7J6EVG5_CANSA|nr:hypothetical protein F8388_012215 [Cannabis sativa]KAF4390967.1 hypothetical protein G4B88_030645 [Cannabis sativa]